MLSGYTSSKEQGCSDGQGGGKPDEERMRREELVTVNTNKYFAKFC